MSLTSYRAAPPRVTFRAKAQPENTKSATRADTRKRKYNHCENAIFGWPGNDLLSQVLRHSTIGADVLNGRVRDGIGFYHVARATRPAKDWKQAIYGLCLTAHDMRAWAMRAIKPIEVLVLVSSMGHPTYTPSLSTWSSSTPLKGALVLRWVSRLDAFSGYPVHT